MTRTLSVLCIGIVALDAVESAVSRSAAIPYATVMLAQIVAYLGIGFVLRRRGWSLRDTVLVAALTALVDTTVGEAVTIEIHPPGGTPLAQAAVTAPFVIVVEALRAIAGFAVGARSGGMRRVFVTIVTSGLIMIGIELVLIAVSLATGDRDWWNGIPVIFAFVLLGIGLRRFNALPEALLGVAVASVVADTFGFSLVDLLHAPGTGPRPMPVFDDDTPWVIAGFTLIGAAGVAIGSLRPLRKASSS